MSTDMYGYEEANPYGYGEAAPSDASKLGYESTSDNKYGYESTDNIHTPSSSHGDNDPYGYGDSNPYGYGDDSQAEAPPVRERPRRRGSVTKFSLDEVQEVKESFESSPQNQEANSAPPPVISAKPSRKLKLKNPLSRKK